MRAALPAERLCLSERLLVNQRQPQGGRALKLINRKESGKPEPTRFFGSGPAGLCNVVNHGICFSQRSHELTGINE